MQLTRWLAAGVLASTAATALACPLPSLVVIPAKDKVLGVEADIRAATAHYFESMKAFTSCVQAELSALGDAAHPSVRAALVRRNNAAVAEAEAVLKLFNANVGPSTTGAPAP